MNVSCLRPWFLFSALMSSVSAAGPDLEQAFTAPAQAAKPRAYWFHMRGNITKPGITADLEAMKEIGLAGTLFMNVSVGVPTGLVETKEFMSPAWQDCFQHMLNESARLELDFGSALCDGWGNAGGPAIPPELAMQQLTWSETRISSGQTVEVAKLPQPTTLLDYYRDVAVLALPLPAEEEAPPPASQKRVRLVRPQQGPAELRFDFSAPVTVCELTLSEIQGQNPFGDPVAVIEASDDGKSWRKVTQFATSWRGHPRTDLTVAFDAVTAKQFRLLYPPAGYFRGAQVTIGEAAFSNRPRIHFWQAKAAIISHNEHGGGAPRFLDAGAGDAPGAALASIVNLTGKERWIAPSGKWLVLRIGHTPTGAHNAPATEAGVGLECDKLNPAGVEAQQRAFVDKVLAAALPAAKKAYKHTWIDSWEVGPQNWTARFAAEFKTRRGDDIIPWLPVICGGRIVGSRDQSERLLWDFRRTIADLFVDYYWRRATQLAEERGIEFRAESFGRQQFMYDVMNYARANHMPCGEFWVGGGPRVDCKAAASAAHLSGRQIAGAEAFTAGRGNWLDDPWSLKTLGDRAFCLGVNQYYFHRYAHQPWLHLAPGMPFGPYGINFERTNTWWKPGRTWIEYITRCQSLLQQGRFVADVLVMLDEGAPTYGGWRSELAIPLPAGFDYDFANLNALRESRVEKGRIVHEHGMSYRLLMLPGTGRATPALLREVLRLAESGAAVAAPRPLVRAHGMGSDAEVAALWPLVRAHGMGSDAEVAALWQKIAATGRLCVAEEFAAVEKQFRLQPDFQHNTDAELLWIHRTDDAGADWYFVSNQADTTCDAHCTFRVTGRQPELWDAATGAIRTTAQFAAGASNTTVRIPFDPRGSWFVVFRKPVSPLAVALPPAKQVNNVWIVNGRVVEEKELPDAVALDERWELAFQSQRGAPPSICLPRLLDLSQYPDESIKHFSGTITYRKTIQRPNAKAGAETRFWLDLGAVGNLAEVLMNGRSLGVLWKRPFRVDVTDALRDGDNGLEIRVTNLWVNRLIGDVPKMDALGVTYNARNGVITKWPAWVPLDVPPPDAPVSFVGWRQWQAGDPLQPSGLIGPVRLGQSRLGPPATTGARTP